VRARAALVVVVSPISIPKPPWRCHSSFSYPHFLPLLNPKFLMNLRLDRTYGSNGYYSLRYQRRSRCTTEHVVRVNAVPARRVGARSRTHDHLVSRARRSMRTEGSLDALVDRKDELYGSCAMRSELRHKLGHMIPHTHVIAVRYANS